MSESKNGLSVNSAAFVVISRLLINAVLSVESTAIKREKPAL
jgi:hypothetical protein